VSGEVLLDGRLDHRVDGLPVIGIRGRLLDPAVYEVERRGANRAGVDLARSGGAAGEQESADGEKEAAEKLHG
jgi:hypothetical protein